MSGFSVKIEDSFELLTQSEWDKFLGTHNFDEMRIGLQLFNSYKSQIMLYPRLEESIKGLFNKVGALQITYALCRHYYDKGIPDDPWYISPGKEGQSIQYVPNFEDAHWMRRYWFNHFAGDMYLTFFSYWDGIVGLLNIFYGIDEPVQDYRFRQKVMAALKSGQRGIFDFMSSILDEPIYKTANEYRTSFVHGLAPSEVSEEYTLKKGGEAEIPTLVDGKLQMVKKPILAQMSADVGKYTLVKTVMENIDDFALFSGEKVQALLKLMV